MIGTIVFIMYLFGSVFFLFAHGAGWTNGIMKLCRLTGGGEWLWIIFYPYFTAAILVITPFVYVYRMGQRFGSKRAQARI